MSDEITLPRNLHKPMQILWFDMNEVYVIVFFYLVSMIASQFVVYLISPPLAYLFIAEYRNSNRGFLYQIGYNLGLINFKGYPEALSKNFSE
jgi:hypothetical protein